MPDIGDGEVPAGSLLEGVVARSARRGRRHGRGVSRDRLERGRRAAVRLHEGEALGRFAREISTLVGDSSHVELEEALVRDGRVQGELRARRGDGTIAEVEVFIRRVHDPPGYVGSTAT